MPPVFFVCPECGSTQGSRVVYYIEETSEIAYINGLTGEYEDYRDHETMSSEKTGDDPIICTECSKTSDGMTNEFKTIDELFEFRIEHTDNNGKWHKNELPKSKQSKKLMNELLVIKLENNGGN